MLTISQLEKSILLHKRLYYQGKPKISNDEYDKLEEKLKALYPQSPVLQAVGTATFSGKKIKHESKMLSLAKVYSVEELWDWADNRELVSTYKIDGVSCSLIYKQGILTLAKTRGDGTYGEKITDKILWIDSIPKHIDEKSKLEIRGELYCDKKNFSNLADEMESIGLKRPSSQRNIVAGLMGRKENIELCRHIDFRAFELISHKIELSTEWEQNRYIKTLGFKTPNMVIHKDKNDVKRQIEKSKSFINKGDYQIDGLVFSLNSIKLHYSLGETAHHPRYKMALKFKGESKHTILKKISWSVSRNGILTPIGEVEPVELSGAQISQVSLHNYGMVKERKIKSGDTIEIIRSGEVIPKFLSIVKSSSEKFTTPQNCPECQNPVIIKDIRLCCNNENCQAKTRESILHFIRNIGIDDISSKRLEEMMRKGLVKTISDLYGLNKAHFLTLDKIKNKLAEKFVATINASKQCDLPTFLSALGIQGGGKTKCEKIVDAGFDEIEKILRLTLVELEQVESFAQKSAQEFLKSLQSKHSLIEELISVGFQFENQRLKKNSPITQKKLCLTGALSRKRSLIEEEIKNSGGVIVSTVSKNTDYLITNEQNSTSSKFTKAQKLNVPIISEKELFEMLEGNST